MISEHAVLVIDDEHEATLISSAIALHAPQLRVRAVSGWRAGLAYVGDNKGSRMLVILGEAAVREASQAMPLLNGSLKGLTVVGLAAGVGAAAKEHALAAGVRAVHERPASWAAYAQTVRDILESWSDAQRVGAGRQFDRSSERTKL